MKTNRADSCLYEIPELEETEFEFLATTCRGVEDSNDIGHWGDSMCIAMDVTGDLPMFDA